MANDELINEHIAPHWIINKSDSYQKACYRVRHSSILKRMNKAFLLLLLIIISAGAQEPARALNNNSDYLKLYAHSRLINDEQYRCFVNLITKESNWRIAAKNGSHYGIGQMRNKRYGQLDGFSQVDWSIRYIKERYGSMCNAWRFFMAKGYH